ncbi:hypothetical protein [Clostridium sp.]|uniref:hypothetical protein n=1 Tax=Clostridium sp. TaxID=1506 RepID=UPI001A419810|nr:hypothetical protein [Clostridium sp.]MBK5237343.1 hypothetical protein [Clostridium sp.]
MKNIIIPKLDYKQMKTEITDKWYAKQEGKGYTIMLSINETVEQIGDKLQEVLREKINENLKFNIYMDEEGIFDYRLSYSIGGEGEWTIFICNLEDEKYDDDYNFARNCINKVLSSITVENLKICKEYAEFLFVAKDKYNLRIMYGDSNCMNVSKNSVSVPGELIAYKHYSDIIRYFVRNSNRIMKRREKAFNGRYFFKDMKVQRSEVRKTISSIDYTQFEEVFKVL